LVYLLKSTLKRNESHTLFLSGTIVFLSLTKDSDVLHESKNNNKIEFKRMFPIFSSKCKKNQ